MTYHIYTLYCMRRKTRTFTHTTKLLVENYELYTLNTIEDKNTLNEIKCISEVDIKREEYINMQHLHAMLKL